LQDPDQRAHDERRGDRGPPGPADRGPDELGHDYRGEAGHESARQVDLAEEEGEHLAHREQAEDGGLHQEVDEVAGGQEVVVERLEQDRDEQQASDHR